MRHRRTHPYHHQDGLPVASGPGWQLTYSSTFANTGFSAATAVKVVDTVPAGTTLSNAGGGTPVGNTVEWNIGR